MATPNKNTSAMTSLLLLHCLRCHRGDARGSVGRAGGGVLSAQTCQESRSTSACLGLAPEALPTQQNQAQTCLPVCLSAWARAYQSIRSSICLLAVCPASTYFTPQLTARPSATPITNTVRTNTLFFFFALYHQRLIIKLSHQATQLGNHSISAYHLISVSHSGSLPYVNQCESSVLHVHVEHV